MIIDPIPISAPSQLDIPLKLVKLECGFPSPAADWAQKPLDLNTHLISHPNATYYARANGDSLIDLGIHDNDLLIVNRSASYWTGSVVVVSLDGELACKILDVESRCFRSGNSEYPPIEIPENTDMDVVIEGVVTHAIHYLVQR